MPEFPRPSYIAGRPDIEEKFDSRFVISESGCWEWVGGMNTGNGYGQIWNGQRKVLAHRYSYERVNGQVPKELELDHLCKNTLCVNPEHLEAVTRRVNMQRADSPNRVKTHCIRGHEFTEENTVFYTTGGYDKRNCKTCVRANSARWYAANKDKRRGGKSER